MQTIRPTKTPENDVHSAFVTSSQVDNAFEYLKRVNANVAKPMIVLGDSKYKSIMERLKMPSVPLKKSNKGYRKMILARNKKLSPLQKIVKVAKTVDLRFMAPFDTVIEIEGNC